MQSSKRPHPDHARRQPAAQPGGHRRDVRARAAARRATAAKDDAVITDAVAEVVRRQVEVGIDIVSDGEMSKISYATYIEDRSPASTATPRASRARTWWSFPAC